MRNEGFYSACKEFDLSGVLRSNWAFSKVTFLLMDPLHINKPPPRTLPVLCGDDPYSAFTTSWAKKITVQELVIQCTAYQPEYYVTLLCVSVEWKLIHHFRTALSCWGCVGTDAFSFTGTSRLLETQSVKHELRSLGNNDIVWCCRLQNERWLVSKILLG